MFQLAYCEKTKDHWIIEDETEEVFKGEDLSFTFDEVWEATQQADACCMDEPEDVRTFLQVLLDIRNKKIEARKATKIEGQ